MTASQSEKTIAAISTAQAPGGIGIVRISGPRARAIADKVFRGAHGKTLAQAAGYTALYGHIETPEHVRVDQAIALMFAAPASFTGEDVVELSCHGGLTVMKQVLRLVLDAGAETAGPGEFTRRAYLNGKMDLTKAESVMALISAQGDQAARIAAAGLQGALSKRIGKIRDKLVATAAHLSAWADYPEEEIPELDPVMLGAGLSDVQEELDELLLQFDTGRVIREGVDTVIAGRPNVGKSTLMNLLSGCERSIVTQYAGTTRDIVEETVLLGGVALRLADTAGLRETEDPVEQIGVEKARERFCHAELVFAVFDSSQELSPDDLSLIDALAEVPKIAVVNKDDLAPKINLAYIKDHFQQIVSLSAKAGTGLKELEQAVGEVLHTGNFDPSQGVLMTERQRDAAQRARAGVEEALEALGGGVTLDAVTVLMEDAISDLLELTGERVTDAVVDSVFAHFCVGK